MTTTIATTYEVQISARSGNSKTGPIPTTMRPMTTCPSDCPFLPTGEVGGCYGTGRIFDLAARHSDYLSEDDMHKKLSKGVARSARYLRDRVVGDILDDDGAVDMGYIHTIARVAQAKDLVPFGYTHAWRRMTKAQVRATAKSGYVLNASCETVDDVRQAVDLGLPVVIAGDEIDEGAVIAGKRVVTCPAQTRDDVTCASCGLCAKPQRKAVVRFLLHGASKKKAARAVAGREET